MKLHDFDPFMQKKARDLTIKKLGYKIIKDVV